MGTAAADGPCRLVNEDTEAREQGGSTGHKASSHGAHSSLQKEAGAHCQLCPFQAVVLEKSRVRSVTQFSLCFRVSVLGGKDLPRPVQELHM